jgi:hypothetical protein
VAGTLQLDELNGVPRCGRRARVAPRQVHRNDIVGLPAAVRTSAMEADTVDWGLTLSLAASSLGDSPRARAYADTARRLLQARRAASPEPWLTRWANDESPDSTGNGPYPPDYRASSCATQMSLSCAPMVQ